MHPIIAQIGPLCIYSYGMMVSIGFAVAIILAYTRAAEFGLDKDRIIDFGIVVLLGGLAGARLFYVLLNMEYYLSHPLEIINVTRGGLVWYGAFISGILIAIIFVKKNNINFWMGADLLAPYIALAQGIGRIGCFLNGCCYGSIIVQPSNYVPYVAFPGESVFRHPTQIYSSLCLIFLFVILRALQRKRLFNGEIFLGYVVGYAVIRFGLEFLRGDNPKILLGLTISQLISVVVFAVGLTLFLHRFYQWKKSS